MSSPPPVTEGLGDTGKPRVEGKVLGSLWRCRALLLPALLPASAWGWLCCLHACCASPPCTLPAPLACACPACSSSCLLPACTLTCTLPAACPHLSCLHPCLHLTHLHLCCLHACRSSPACSPCLHLPCVHPACTLPSHPRPRRLWDRPVGLRHTFHQLPHAGSAGCGRLTRASRPDSSHTAPAAAAVPFPRPGTALL